MSILIRPTADLSPHPQVPSALLRRWHGVSQGGIPCDLFVTSISFDPQSGHVGTRWRTVDGRLDIVAMVSPHKDLRTASLQPFYIRRWYGMLPDGLPISIEAAYARVDADHGDEWLAEFPILAGGGTLEELLPTG